jgi:hypothetical protein
LRVLGLLAPQNLVDILHAVPQCPKIDAKETIEND